MFYSVGMVRIRPRRRLYHRSHYGTDCKYALNDVQPRSHNLLQLTKQQILSRQLRRRIARLVHVVVGCGILTGTLPQIFSLDVHFKRYY